LDRTTGVGRFSILWPFIDYKSLNGTTTEASILWWLVDYVRPDEDHKEFRILGGSAMALVRRKVTPERSTFEFNPVIPFYFYEAENGKLTEMNLLGFGVCTNKEGQKRMRALWICL
jgi:hypothetical protein